jgi:hypothetical protein
MQCWDDERADPNRTITRIINGVFHHPAQRMMGEDGAADGRRLMFGVVEQWWGSADQQVLRQKLSREGVLNGENHLEGVHDTGHGCGKPLGMAKNVSGGSGGPLGAAATGLMGALAGSGGGSEIEKFAEEAVGGGAMGGLLGALAGGVGGGLLSGTFGGRDEPETQSYSSRSRTQEGGYQQSYTEVGHSRNQYAQAQYSETQLPGGGRETDYQRFQQQGEYGSGFEQRTETRPTYGGGYEQTTERTYQRSDEVETETWREGRTADGRHYHESQPEYRRERRGSGSGSDSDGSGRKKHHHKHHSREEERGDYIAPNEGYGEPRRETFEERRHEREFESQPSYEAPRRDFEERNEYRSEGFQNEGYGSRGGYGEEARQEEYRQEVREEESREEVREEEYREERSEGGGWFS